MMGAWQSREGKGLEGESRKKNDFWLGSVGVIATLPTKVERSICM